MQLLDEQPDATESDLYELLRLILRDHFQACIAGSFLPHCWRTLRGTLSCRWSYKRNVLRTPANNKIRLDDERDKEHIKVSTEYGGKSQLNLGQGAGGNIITWSTQDTHISSGKKMVITAQDELTLICGGGYIKIKGGNVEMGGPGKLLIKNTGIRKAGSGNMQSVMKSFEPSTFDEKFIIRNALTKEPLAGNAYKITMPIGSIFSGVTDDSGATSLNSSDVIDNMIISSVKAN